MPKFAELEMALRRRDAGGYTIELRFNSPDADAEVRLLQDGPGAINFDLAKLRSLEVDTNAYGMALSQSLFHDPTVAAAFGQARTAVLSQDATLRLRLFLEPSATTCASCAGRRCAIPLRMLRYSQASR